MIAATCPHCGKTCTYIRVSVPIGVIRKRVHQCINCGYKWTSAESPKDRESALRRDKQFARLIASVVATHFGTGTRHILGRSSMKAHRWPRMVAMYVARELGMKFPAMARAFERDTATVQSNVSVIRCHIRWSQAFAREIGEIKDRCLFMQAASVAVPRPIPVRIRNAIRNLTRTLRKPRRMATINDIPMKRRHELLSTATTPALKKRLAELYGI